MILPLQRKYNFVGLFFWLLQANNWTREWKCLFWCVHPTTIASSGKCSTTFMVCSDTNCPYQRRTAPSGFFEYFLLPYCVLIQVAMAGSHIAPWQVILLNVYHRHPCDLSHLTFQYYSFNLKSVRKYSRKRGFHNKHPGIEPKIKCLHIYRANWFVSCRLLLGKQLLQLNT